MALFEALIQGVRERARQKDISRLQKAKEMLELQRYLQSVGRGHSTRELAYLTDISQSTVTGQLAIAQALTDEALGRVGVTPEEIGHLCHGELLRIAKLPAYLRTAPLRQAARARLAEPVARGSTLVQRASSVREQRRASAYARMRDEGRFHVQVDAPVTELSRNQAYDFLDDMLPAVANLAEIVMGSSKSYYIGVTGNGGILVYLGPQGS